MSHYNPHLLSEDEAVFTTDTSNHNNVTEDNLNTPKVQLCKLRLNQLNQPLLIFDLDTNITVIIGDVPVPSTIFDYLNPLLVHAHSDIYFYKEQEQLDEVNCYCLHSQLDLTPIMSATIYYPPDYYIDYAAYKIRRNGDQKQFWEQIHPENITPFLNVSHLPRLDINEFRQMLEVLTGSDQIRIGLLAEDEEDIDSYD